MPKSAKRRSKAKQRPKVDVVAPSDLDEGYQFYVDTDDKKTILVEVPSGGVTEGDTFRARIIKEFDRGSQNIPYGRWRDGLFDCFKHGVCHPQWLLTCWCHLCALGQVLTRMKLDICGLTPQTGQKIALSAFKIMCMITATFWFAFTLISIVIMVLRGDGGSAQINEDGTETIKEGKSEPERLWIAIWFRVFIGLSTIIFAWVATINARAHIRRKHDIPTKCCRSCEDTCCSLIENGLVLDGDVRKNCCSCEDMCCSLWCAPCTVCQMARHTADYEKYPASCCMDDGLQIVDEDASEKGEEDENAPAFDVSENVEEVEDVSENVEEADASENVEEVDVSENAEEDDPSDSPEGIV